MTSEQQRRVRELFEEALDVRPDDTAGWLQAASPDDESVRREVISLIDHHGRAGRFLVDAITEQVPELLGDDAPLQPGGRVGEYVVVRELGRGGMGCVYLARDERLGRDVALKALAPRFTSDPAQRERLRREARAAASLSHPGICTVYALLEVGDDLFIASEVVDGTTLRSEIAGGRRPPPDEAIHAARELAGALASAHTKGITHRDLKPENVMRTADGRWKILDFGLARVDPAAATGLGRSFATQPGTIVGTPAYMAPEQLNGEVAGTPADVFAFGVLLYEWITGVHPFAAATPLALLARLLESDAVPVAARAPHLPAPLAHVIDRCLLKSAAARFASAAEIVAALDRGEAARPGRAKLTWWRTHQSILMVLYAIAATVGWHVKETLAPGPLTLWLFVSLGICAASSGILRGHLLFTERMNRSRLDFEHRKTARAITAVDLAIAAVLSLDGLLVVSSRALWAVFTLALALGIALATIVMEPATTAAAFGHRTRAR